VRRLVVALVAAAAALPAAPAAAESPRRGTFEFRMNRFRPDVDAEFGGAATPYEDAFGSGKGWMFRIEVTRSLLKTFGTLDVGVGAGYFQDTGRGLLPADPVNPGAPRQTSADRTTLRIIPTSLSLTYRLDVLPNGFVMPLVPYGRASLERYNWWTSGGGGGTSEVGGLKGRGATHGYSLSAGVALLLDILDRGLAREMDADTGVNHTYLFFDVTKSVVDDFGSSSSIDLSNSGALTLGGGLMFVY
jgi:hypothetical protein